MADDNGMYQDDDQRSPLDAVMSPLASRGIDPDAARANPQLFAKLPGGGIGMSGGDDSAPQASKPPLPLDQPALHYRDGSLVDYSPPQLQGTPNAPAQPPTTGSTPAAVTQSGSPSGPNIEEQAAQRSFANMNAVPTVADQQTRMSAAQAARDAAQAKLDEGLKDSSGKLLPQYRPSVGQRIWRGARGALEGLAMGGIPGAIRGAVVPQMYPGDKAYGDPNDAGQQELRRERGALTSANQSLTELGKNFKNAQEAAEKSATGYKDVAETAKAGEETKDKPPTTIDAFVIQTAKTLYPNDLGAQQKYIDDNSSKGESKHPTTPEGVVADAAYSKFPNDPEARVKYMQQNGIVSPDTAARIAEAQAAHADAMANAASRHDDAMANQENNRYMRYQSQLLKYGQDKQGVDTKVQGEWDKFQREYDKEREKDVADNDGKNVASIDQKYEKRKQELQNNTNGWYKNIQEPQAPPSMAGRSAPSPATPAAVSQTGAPQTPAARQNQSQAKPLNNPNDPQQAAIARSYLQKAGGDKNKARQLAKQDGYSF